MHDDMVFGIAPCSYLSFWNLYQTSQHMSRGTIFYMDGSLMHEVKGRHYSLLQYNDPLPDQDLREYWRLLQ